MDDCTLESGTLHVVPGSHLQNREPEGLLPHRCYPDEVSRFSCAEAVSEGDVVPCATKAGGVVFFSYGIAHSTQDNTSDAERGGIAYHCALQAPHNPPNGGQPIDPWAADGGLAVFGEQFDELSFDEEVAHLLSVPEDAATLSSHPKHEGLPRGYLRTVEYNHSEAYAEQKRMWASEEVQAMPFRDAWDWMMGAVGRDRAKAAPDSRL